MLKDDTSLFSKYYNIKQSVSESNADLEKLNYCACQWKIQFNPDSDKHANEPFFCLELSSNNLSYPRVQFHCNGISKHIYQKQLGIALNS